MKEVVLLLALALAGCQNAPSSDANKTETAEPRAPTEAEIKDYLRKKGQENELSPQQQAELNRRITDLEQEMDGRKSDIRLKQIEMEREKTRLFRRYPNDTLRQWSTDIERHTRRIENIQTELSRLYELRGHKESPEVTF